MWNRPNPEKAEQELKYTVALYAFRILKHLNAAFQTRMFSFPAFAQLYIPLQQVLVPLSLLS